MLSHDWSKIPQDTFKSTVWSEDENYVFFLHIYFIDSFIKIFSCSLGEFYYSNYIQYVYCILFLNSDQELHNMVHLACNVKDG